MAGIGGSVNLIKPPFAGSREQPFDKLGTLRTGLAAKGGSGWQDDGGQESDPDPDLRFYQDGDSVSLLSGSLTWDYENMTEEVAMDAASGFRMKRPAHPGSFVKHEIVEAFGLSVTAAAAVLGVTRATLSTLLNERSSLSSEMALRIEKAFGVSMDTLMRMRTSYDIAQTRERADEIKVLPFSTAAPGRTAAAT